MEEKFWSVYGQQLAHLQILGTHPDYQRMGAASALLRHGIRRGQDLGLPITLFASPMGKPLYTSFGFVDRGKVVVRVDGEDQSTDLNPMLLDITDSSEAE
jgi:ribosomal protein S18 acetylase RimI-like enzyme